MSNFVVQFLLKTEKFQEDVLNKRFETARKIYNCLVTITQNRYKGKRIGQAIASIQNRKLFD